MSIEKTTKTDLLQWIQSGEGQFIEFKRDRSEKLAHALVAFANAVGGRIIIGVDDSGNIVGTDCSNSEISAIQNVAQNCTPSISIEVEKLASESVFIVHINEGTNKPYSFKGAVYERNGANSQKLSVSAIAELSRLTTPIHFDSSVRKELKWEEVLDHDRLKHFLKLSEISPQNNLKRMLYNLCAGDIVNEEFCFNQAGLLFFAKEPKRHLTQSSVVCTLFQGNSRTEILNSEEFTGSIAENINDAVLYLRKQLNSRYLITGKSATREEVLEVPEIALREAITNAVCHRDYSIAGSCVDVSIYRDRVEIVSPGGLPRGLKPSDFGNFGVRRNPLLADLLQRSKYIEKLGTGISRIKKSLSEAGCEPFSFHSGDFFTITFLRYGIGPTASSLRDGGQDGSQDGGQDGGQERYIIGFIKRQDTWVFTQEGTSQKVFDAVINNYKRTGKHEAAILSLLLLFQSGDYTTKQLLEASKMKSRSHFRKTYILPALEVGALELTIPDMPNHRMQKHRITSIGIQLLKKLHELGSKRT